MKPIGIQKGVLGTLNNGVYPHAFNVRVDNDTGTIVEEEGLSVIFNNEIAPIGRITTNRGFVVFGSQNQNTGIWLVSDNDFIPIILSEYLGLTLNHPIEGDFTYDSKGNLIIVWTDNYNPVRYLNIGCNSLKLNANKEFINPNDVKLLNLFPTVTIPNFTISPFDFGSLLSGAYQIAIAYVNGDDITNYITISNWITVTSKEKINGYSNYDGDETGLKTKKAISVLITDLDSVYSKIHVAIIRKIKGVVTAYSIGNYQYVNGVKRLVITGNEIETIISLEEIIVGVDTYYRAKTIIQLQERLTIANLTKLPAPKYQKYANNIKINWVREDDIALTKVNGSYKDEVFIFNKRGFKTNEVKSFYIVLRMIDGTYSQAFHIPNTQTLNSYLIGSTTYDGNLVINSLPVNNAIHPLIEIAPNHRLNQLLNNATDNGKMGLWLNEDETYPDTDCYDIHNAIGKIGTLRNEQVRHHRFPSISQLESWQNPYVTTGNNTSIGNILILVGGDVPNGADSFMIIDDPTDIDNAGSFNGTNYNYTFQRAGTFNLHCNFNGNNVRMGDTARFFIELTNSAGTNVIYEKSGEGAFNGLDFEFKFEATLTIKAGDKLRVVGGVTASLIGTGWAYSGHLTNNAFLIIEDATLETLTTKSKILGIRISDVHIPPDIAPYVDSWEIYYGESTLNNSLVLGQALVKRFGAGEIRAYSWDILYNKPNTIPIYVHNHIGYKANPNTNFLIANEYLITEQLNAITSYEYYPADVPLGDEYRIKMETATFNTISNADYYLVDLMLIKRNLFVDVFNQNLIATGRSFKVGVTSVNKLYGGDIFISAFGWRIHADYLDASKRYGGGVWTPDGKDVVGLNYSVLMFAHESISNVGMRYYDDVLKTQYAPKYLVMNNIAGKQGMSYDKTFNSINDTIKLIGAWCTDSCDEDIVRFPYRIARSAVKGSESKSFNWRKFKANDYYDMPKNKGVIWKINVLKDTLIIHTEHSYFIAMLKDRMISDTIEIYLGQGDIFDRKPDEPVSVIEGYAGCKSQWSSIITANGELFVDVEQKRIYMFNGKLQDIGKSIQVWLDIMIHDIADNPFSQYGITCGYDSKYNRALVTYFGENYNWTLSYNFDTNSWISYHGYSPVVYLNNYNKLWSIAVDLDTSMVSYAIHNIKGSIRHHFAIKANSFIDIYFKYKDRVELQGMDWVTIIKDVVTGKEDFNETIHSILVYTANQCTKYNVIKPLQDFKILGGNSRSNGNRWSFSSFRDILIDKSMFPMDNLGNVKNGILKPSQLWFKSPLIVNDYIVVRLVFNNKVNKQTYLTDVIPFILQSKR